MGDSTASLIFNLLYVVFLVAAFRKAQKKPDYD